MKLQGELFNTAGDFISDVYKNTASPRVYLARNVLQPETGEREWFQQGFNLAEAIDTANSYQKAGSDDCYTTVNGFDWSKGTGRTVSSVTQLTCLWVDFDYYNTEHGDLNVADFAQMICDENPWLPEPTTVMDSGKGCWMFWQFRRPMKMPSPYDWLAQWQTCQDFIVSQLEPYGADPKCCDAARVVRLTETINSKTGRTAQAWKTKSRYEFKDLKQAINDQYKVQSKAQREAFDLVPAEAKKSKKRLTSGGRVSPLFNFFSLAHARLKDLKTLAKLRGGRYEENRRRAIWCYAVEAANFCRDEPTLRAEVEAFITEFIADSDKYLKTVNYESTVTRFKNHMQIRLAGQSSLEKIREALGDKNDKYRLTHEYMVKHLGITEAEQRKLKVIIGANEKRRRNTDSRRIKRRQEGAQARADYDKERQAQVSEKASEALRLRLEGLSIRAIAKEMNTGVTNVHRWLSKA